MNNYFSHRIPKLNLPPEGRESIRIARHFAKTGIILPFTVPLHNWPGPPAEPYRPENSGESIAEPWHTLEDLERLQRTQAIVDQGIQDRIREAEVCLPTHPATDTEQDKLEMERYFSSVNIPAGPLRIGAVTIHEPLKAIHAALSGLKASPSGSLSERADINNLRELKAALEATKCDLN